MQPSNGSQSNGNNAPASTLTIGEVAAAAGIEASTLRYYERIGLLPPPPRRSGRRCYTPHILPLLAIIKLAKDAQFTLPEIHQLLYTHDHDSSTLSDRWRMLAARKLEEINQIISRALEMKHLLEEGLESDSLHWELDQCPPLENAKFKIKKAKKVMRDE